MTLRLALLALFAVGCGHATPTALAPRTAQTSFERPLEPALRKGPRLGPFAGAGSGVRRVDVVAQR